jgi:hypothetical protein
MEKQHNWRGLYRIGLLAVGLLVADALAPLSLEGHDIVTVGIVLLAFGLTAYWTEKHADLVETEGIDADTHRRWFIAQGQRYILAQPTPQEEQPEGNTANTEQRKYAILSTDLLHKV